VGGKKKDPVKPVWSGEGRLLLGKRSQKRKIAEKREGDQQKRKRVISGEERARVMMTLETVSSEETRCSKKKRQEGPGGSPDKRLYRTRAVVP